MANSQIRNCNVKYNFINLFPLDTVSYTHLTLPTSDLV